jgi:cytoskeletal protein CcmA (bactofilin family)
MLKKMNKGGKEGPTEKADSSPAVEPPPAPRPAPVDGGKQTIIGEHITIEGAIRGRENLVIDGSMKGNIELAQHQFTVGPKGKVEAEILAENVTVSGRLAGNIQASGKVLITREADFSGEIKAKRIAVEDGAFLKAVIELERDAGKAQPKRAGDGKTESEPTVLSIDGAAKG